MKNVFYFIFGCLSVFKIRLGGDFYIIEILSALFLLFNFNRVKVNDEIRTFIYLLLVWSLAQLTSDLYNGTSPINTLKGTLAPCLLLITLVSLFMYFKESKYLTVYMIGVFFGIPLSLIFYQSYTFLVNPWKFGLGSSFLIIYLLIDQKKKNPSVINDIAVVLFVFISLVLSCRSMAIFALIAYIIYRHKNFIIKLKIYKTISTAKGGLLLFIVGSCFALYVANTVLGHIFQNDFFISFFTEDVAEKYKLQASSDLGLLLSGRSELLVSLESFWDKPFLGHGSWAQDEYYAVKYILNQFDNNIAYQNSIELAIAQLRGNYLIPTHSYLMGTLVWAGIFGGLAWLNLLVKLANRFFRQLSNLSFLQIYLIISLAWAIFFSPFGAHARMMTAFVVLLIFNNFSIFEARVKNEI